MHALAEAGKITEAYEIWNVLGPLARICWRRPLRDYRVRMKYTLMRQGVIPCDAARLPQPAKTRRQGGSRPLLRPLRAWTIRNTQAFWRASGPWMQAAE